MDEEKIKLEIELIKSEPLALSERVIESEIFVKTEKDIKPEMFIGVSELDLPHEPSISSDDPLDIAVHEEQKPLGKPQNLNYQCSLCPCVFDKVSGLDEHFSRVHDGKKPEIQDNFPPAKKREETEIEKLVNVPNRCAICFRVLRTKRNLERHHAMVHKEKQTKSEYNCNLCGYSCFKENTLSDHIAAVHLGEKPHECSECNAKFSLNSQLSLHVRTVHEGKKPHKCPECDYSCEARGNLNAHISRVHEGKKPFACVQCDSRFPQKKDLQHHIDSVHEKKKPFKCDSCDKYFSLKHNLNGHIKSVHEKQKPLSCPNCDSTFTSNSKMKLETPHSNSA